MARRREQSRGDEQTHRRNAVGIKIPVQNGERGARMITQHCWIEREAYEHDSEQSDAGQSKSRMWHAAEKPAECCAFQSPTNSDPFSIELDRKDQRNEKQRRAA